MIQKCYAADCLTRIPDDAVFCERHAGMLPEELLAPIRRVIAARPMLRRILTQEFRDVVTPAVAWIQEAEAAMDPADRLGLGVPNAPAPPPPPPRPAVSPPAPPHVAPPAPPELPTEAMPVEPVSAQKDVGPDLGPNAPTLGPVRRRPEGR